VPRAAGASTRDWIARSFTHVEDVLYVALGVLLAAGALVLLADATLTFVTNLLAGTLPARIIGLLDRVLLVLMFAEILATSLMVIVFLTPGAGFVGSLTRSTATDSWPVAFPCWSTALIPSKSMIMVAMVRVRRGV